MLAMAKQQDMDMEQGLYMELMAGMLLTLSVLYRALPLPLSIVLEQDWNELSNRGGILSKVVAGMLDL